MEHITLNLRLRPIRFAFLVNPGNSKQLLEVFRVNTCLWGGKFNPIIPARKNKEGNLSEIEKQTVKKYLDFFEPDFVVETEKGISKDLDFERVLSISSIFTNEPEENGDEFQYGQSVKGLYENLYETEFKSQYPFNPNDPSIQKKYSNIISVKAEIDQFKNFVACNFGDFPEDERLKYFRRNYSKYLSPSFKIFGLNTPDLVYNLRYQSPLDISCKKLKIKNYSNNKPALFLLNMKDNEDLIDFWNLRGVYSNIKAVPVQCIENFSSYLKQFVKAHYPAPDISELQERLDFLKTRGISKITQPVPIFSRSIFKKEAEKFYKIYIKCPHDKVIKSKWETHPFWERSKIFFNNKHQPILEAKRRDIDIKLSERDPEINLDFLFPESKKSGGHFLWTNVITIHDWNHQIAVAFPCSYKKNFINLNILKERFDKYLEVSVFEEHPDNYPSNERIEKKFLSTAEGLIIFSHHKKYSERWILMGGTTLIKNWIQSNKKIEISRVSDAGSTAQQIIQLLGFDSISDFANKDVIELLNDMSGKQKKEKRLKSLDYKKFKDRTNKITKDQVASQIIQALGYKGMNKLANGYVIELLDKISRDGSPKKIHLIEFKEKTNKKINEIINKNETKHYDFNYPPEAEKIRGSQKVIELLGLEKIYYLANKKTIEFLKKKDELDVRKFKEIVREGISLNLRHQKDLPEMLLKKKVIELGMEIKCDKCNKKSWYSLKRLDYSLVCDFCFKSYNFPMIDPILEENKYSKWSYRVIGPFSLLDYAQGGYAVALSIHFFTNIIGRYEARRSPMDPYWHNSPEKSKLDDKVTWSTGWELTLTSEENPIEVDFILWSQRWNQWKVEHSNIIFGEAKSYGRFEKKDIDNMKKLAEIFPGSILVFATMKEYNDFSNTEKERIKRLAEWGREHNRATQKSRALVMVLTGTELFTRSYLSIAYDEKIKKLEEQGKKEQVKKYRKIYNLLIGNNSPFLRPRNLAYLTQYLYLNIPFEK